MSARLGGWLGIDGWQADSGFSAAATSHPWFGASWRSAFAYNDPAVRLDFSDTGARLHILGIGELDIAAFRRRFLEPGPLAR